MAQYIPDAILEAYTQRQVNAGLAEAGGMGRLGYGERQSRQFRPDITAYRAIINNAGVMQAPEFAVARDYSLRASGIAPDQAHQGAPLVSYGGRSFLNTRGRDLGTFTGDVGAFGARLKSFIQGQAAYSAGQGGLDQRGQRRLFQQTQAQFGDFGGGAGFNLASQFGTLSGAQRDQVLGDTGLSLDTVLGFQQQYRGAGERLTEVQNIQDVGEGERVLRGSIQQSQVNRGLFGSAVGAAAEANAVSAFQVSRQQNLQGMLLGGALDPQRIAEGGATASQEQADARVAQLLPRVLGSELGTQNSGIRRPTPGQPLGLVDFTRANPLRMLENPALAMYGNLGSGAVFG